MDEMDEGIEEREEEMEGDMEEMSGMGEEGEQDEMNKSLGFEDIRQIIENNEDEKKNQAIEARTSNFIRKGSYVHSLLM